MRYLTKNILIDRQLKGIDKPNHHEWHPYKVYLLKLDFEKINKLKWQVRMASSKPQKTLTILKGN